jgi:multidrug resistance efflux pump
MFEGDPLMQVLLIFTGLVILAAFALYGWDIWMINRYFFYRHCSCKKRAEKVIVPQALVTVCPVTVECRVITPEAVDIV